MSELISQALVDELVKRQIAEEKFTPRDNNGTPTQPTPVSPMLALLAGQLADTGSTYAFLKTRSRPEANPALQFLNRGAAEKVLPLGAAGALGYLTAYKLLHRNHPGLANILAGLVGGYHGALAGNNVEHEAGNSYYRAARDFRPGKK